jgi:hypothetical protein
MTRYFFILRYSEEKENDDRYGTLLPSDGHALECANQLVQDIKQDRGHDGPGLTMIVKDAAQRVVFSIPF